MATRKKSAKSTERKRASHKKTPSKKTPGKKKAALPVATIGVVTSIELSQALKDAFENALAGAAATIYYGPNAPGYEPDPLVKAVKDFNDHTRIGLIVTFGGVGAASAASHHATDVPWLMLVGGTLGLPTQPQTPPKFFGGVNLDTYEQNAKRLSHFTGNPTSSKSIPASKICLLYNKNSACSYDEATRWTGGSAVAAWVGANDKTQYSNAFNNKVPSDTRVVVISADPYFQQTTEDLVRAANDWIDAGANRRVCYPLQEYSNANGTHKPHGHTLHGPSLVDAYERMGRKARAILRTGNLSTLTTLPIGNPVDH